MNGLTSTIGLNTYVNIVDAIVIVIGILNDKLGPVNIKKSIKYFIGSFVY